MSNATSDGDISTPGWDAIDAALRPLYADQTPKHYGTTISYMLGGPDPLDGISAYKRLDPVPHWHFVTYGFSELYRKETQDPDVSGWGIELTMRVAADAESADPPLWVLSFLQNLARYVFKTGNVFAAGHHLDANGPIALETDTRLDHVVFVQDPELAPIGTSHGCLEFLQVVGVTADEVGAVKQWNTLAVMAVFAAKLPLLVTDLGRPSLLEDPGIRERVAAGSAGVGSNTGMMFVENLDWKETKRLLRTPEMCVSLGAGQVEELTRLLPARLPFGKDFSLVDGEVGVTFGQGAENRFVVTDRRLRIEMRASVVSELQSVLRPVAGEYRLKQFGQLVLNVRKTHIKDAQGNVVRTIG